MARTKAAARKGPAGKAYRMAKRNKRNQADVASLHSKPLHVHDKAPKTLQKSRNAPPRSEVTTGYIGSPENDNVPRILDNKRASDGNAQRPSKKIKKANHGSAENADVQAATLSYSPEIEVSTSFESVNGTEIGVDPKPLENLGLTYTITNMNIISSSKIQQKVSRILETLGSFSFASRAKPNLVLLHAKAPVVQKLITVVDMATREIANSRGKYYQYNRLDRVVVEQERKPALKDDNFTILGRTVELDQDAMEVDEEETLDERAFETMKLPKERAIEGKPIKRVLPGMTIWLSRVRIESLGKAYTYVTNLFWVLPSYFGR